MTDSVKWPVVLVCPGEQELPLLAELAARSDAEIVAIADPTGDSVGAGLAEVMGLRLIRELEELERGRARYLVHPPLNEQVAPFVDLAPDFGLEAVLAAEFSDLAAEPGEDRRPATIRLAQDQNLDFLEIETSTIHRTLSRIEEAMDREALLRWLLGLATRATGAGSGSVMLFDEAAGELYLAFAYGLSERTMHRTRVRLGEGISGRVAASGRPEFLDGRKQPGHQRDRADISSAICAPIIWEGRLLGVINLSSSAGDAQLSGKSLELIESLTHRFGLILDRFLKMQTIRDGELFRRLEQIFSEDTGHPGQTGRTLALWAEDLIDVCGADWVTLSVMTADGELLTAGRDGVVYESPVPPVKAEVMGSGRPLVIRPDEAADATDDGEAPDTATRFLLPVGREPVRALLTIDFATASKAHHFHTVSAEILFLVTRHLTEYLDRAATNDQLERLTELASVLSDLAASNGSDPAADRERLLSASCKLTGARQAHLIQAPAAGDGALDGLLVGTPATPLAPALHREADRLLVDAGVHGWSATIISEAPDSPAGAHGRSLLAVPLDGGGPYPGLLLVDKERLHPLDGLSFSEFDAVFARRLSPLLRDRLHAPRPAAPQPDQAGPTTGPDTAAARPTAGEEQVVKRPLSLAPPVYIAPDTPLLEALTKEMGRCDRYHTMLGLAGFAVAPLPDRDLDTHELVEPLARRLRSSDHVSCLTDGTLMIIVPEDIQSLPRLEKRVRTLLRDLTGHEDLEVASATRVYPGTADSPQALIDGVLRALS